MCCSKEAARECAIEYYERQYVKETKFLSYSAIVLLSLLSLLLLSVVSVGVLHVPKTAMIILYAVIMSVLMSLICYWLVMRIKDRKDASISDSWNEKVSYAVLLFLLVFLCGVLFDILTT